MPTRSDAYRTFVRDEPLPAEELRELLAEDRDLLKVIVEETLQQVLEAEMDEARKQERFTALPLFG